MAEGLIYRFVFIFNFMMLNYFLLLDILGLLLIIFDG